MLRIVRTDKSDIQLKAMMAVHYSHPKGFVGRQLIYKIFYDKIFYGCIAFGSATRFLPGRNYGWELCEGMNNTFYHIEKQNGKYPKRNFTTLVLLEAEKLALVDYQNKYGDKVKWIESLVELPRMGELYLKAGYKLVGQTKGYTCKRVAGISTDSWTGKRVWDTVNLRPKNVFLKEIK